MARRGLFASESSYRLAVPVLIFVYLAIQIPLVRFLFTLGSGLTTDDAMRIVQVRDLMAGQPWYDLTQYRVLPPDGISMHWSRYIDAPMLAILAPLQAVFGADMAARLLAIIWPLAMGAIFLTMTARLTKRLYGPQAAFLSLLVISTYSLLTGSGFGVGATDHHGVQVILMLGVFAAIVLPDQPIRRGLMGGALAALSLAVGLEMMPVIAVAGVILVLHHIAGREGADHRLLAFSGAMALAAPILMAGQLSPTLWTVSVCDALSPALLGVTTAAFLASAAVVLAGRWVGSVPGRVIVALVVTAMAGYALFPIVEPCLAGPYTALSPELQRTVLAQIQEILPAGHYFASDMPRFIAMLLPFYAVTALLAVMVVANRGAGATLLVFLAMAAVLSFWQTRMTTMGLPLISIAFGATVAWAFSASRTPIRLLGLLVLTLVLLSRPLAIGYMNLTWDGPGPATPKGSLGDRCNKIDQMARLNAVAPGIVFNPINFGPMLLLATHHSVTAAPYHRSADAFSNGILPFGGSEDDLKAAVARTGADYVLLCRGDTHGTKDSIGTRLAAGEQVSWLTELAVPQTEMRLLKVVP